MQYKPIQQIKKHSPKCVMLNGMNGDNPWCSPEQHSDYSWTPQEERIERDLAGRKNPRAGHTWVVLRCSDSDCPAKLAIYWPHFEMKLDLCSPYWKEQSGE